MMAAVFKEDCEVSVLEVVKIDWLDLEGRCVWRGDSKLRRALIRALSSPLAEVVLDGIVALCRAGGGEKTEVREVDAVGVVTDVRLALAGTVRTGRTELFDANEASAGAGVEADDESGSAFKSMLL